MMNIKKQDKCATLVQKAAKLRQEIIKSVQENGGHLAGNLGVVELTLVLHELFTFPKDKLIFDVGHQSYAHKLLTGRSLHHLRQQSGVSGFSDPAESTYDSFIAGHSGNSIAAAIGLAFARDRQNADYKIIVVIGDASITNGLALESLFASKEKPKNMIVILNDNHMSISENKSSLQSMDKYARKNLFESCGLTYIDGGDGHNFENLMQALTKAKENESATLVDIQTIKGKGWDFAEKSPCETHSLQKDFIPAQNDFSNAMANCLCNIAEKEKNLVVITPAMQYGLALTTFFEKFPDRAIDVGICESYAFTLAAGVAKGGLKPILCTYATFMQRAYDQIIHDICLQNLPVIICLDRAGFVGGDGKTHHGLQDVQALRTLPNLQIYTPKDCQEGEEMLQFALQQNGPVVLRYPNASIGQMQTVKNFSKENLWEILQQNSEETVLLANGARMVERAMLVAKKLPDITVINARTIKPLDDKILYSIKDKNIFTLEEGYLAGGFGSAVAEFYSKNNVKVNLEIIALPDIFIGHGKIEEQVQQGKISTKDIVERIEKKRENICKI